MNLVTASVYWVIVGLWLVVLSTIIFFFAKNPRAFGTTRLLLAVLLVDTSRNLVENVYFGLYFGSLYGLFDSGLTRVLGSPILLLTPKLFNVLAGCIVLSLLLLRWLPLAVTERDRSEHDKDVAEAAARLKDEFISTVSHELRTPLTAITASLALLEDTTDPGSSEETKDLIATAYSNCKRLRRLVDDILDIEKLEAGKIKFRLQAVRLDALLKQEVAANRSLADQSGVVLRLDAAELSIQTDPDRLKQVVSNLLSNAIKFSPRDAEVQISAVDAGDRFRIAIRDHGPGISEEFRARIFGKFAQADTSDSRSKSGTGLGLSIVKEIVQRLGGEVGFENARDGGAIFFLELPRAANVAVDAPSLAARQDDGFAAPHAKHSEAA
jgi:signal transduction histidine kinase